MSKEICVKLSHPRRGAMLAYEPQSYLSPALVVDAE